MVLWSALPSVTLGRDFTNRIKVSPKSTDWLRFDHFVKECIAMMLPLICLTGTPSNRIALLVGVLQWITMDYSFVIQTVVLVVTQSVPAKSARGQ